MRADVLNFALPRLRRSLGVGEECDGVLSDKLELAEEEILRYLNRTELPEYAHSLLIELAGLRYLQQQSAGKKASAYAEGQISQSDTFYSAAEFSDGVDALLRTLAPYRRIKCRGDGA